MAEGRIKLAPKAEIEALIEERNASSSTEPSADSVVLVGEIVAMHPDLNVHVGGNRSLPQLGTISSRIAIAASTFPRLYLPSKTAKAARISSIES